MIALVRGISARIADCELTHLDRTVIDLEAARAEHAEYVSALERLGCDMLALPPLEPHPDCVFVEDSAVVVEELAVMTRPGASSRHGELPTVEAALAPHRPIAQIEAPGTLDGGDVLVVGRHVHVGRGKRSNDEGIRQLGAHLEPFGYTVRGVDFDGCLHLKSACSLASSELLLLNPDWVDPATFGDIPIHMVAPSEPHAGNVLWVGDTVIVASAFPETAAGLRARGLDVLVLDNFELAKAEGGLTCGSILFD